MKVTFISILLVVSAFADEPTCARATKQRNAVDLLTTEFVHDGKGHLMALSRSKPITKEAAIRIATQYIKEKEPQLDISTRPPRAEFFADQSPFGAAERGAWTVTFGIPSPPGYSRPIISHHVFIDRFGRILGIPLTTSP
jgi:hypothetical protein